MSRGGALPFSLRG